MHDQEQRKWDAFYASLPVIEEDPINRAFGEEFAQCIRGIMPEGGTTLEAGSGAGWQSLALARTGGYQVSLLDFSAEALACARRAYADENVAAEFIQGDVFAPDDQAYDLVFNIGVLEDYTFDEQVAFLRAMAGRSRKFVLVLVPNQLCYWYWLWRMHKDGSGDWTFRKEVPLVDMAAAFAAACLHFHGQAFMGANWTEGLIQGLPGLDDALRSEILTIHRNAPNIPEAQKSYLVAFLGSTQEVTDVDTRVWAAPQTRESMRDAELNAMLADALSLRIGAENKITQLQTQLEESARNTVREVERVQTESARHERAALLEAKDKLLHEWDQREEALLQEMDSMCEKAAIKERGLTEERDGLQYALDVMYSTKAWRATQTYWAAREKGILAPVSLATSLAKYGLRVGYHLAVPYKLRRDLWHRRHVGTSYSAFAESLELAKAKASAQVDAAPAKHADRVIVKAPGPDIICFPVIDWDSRFQRPQQLLTQFARAGHRGYYLTTRFSGFDQTAVSARTLGPGLQELTLPGDSDIVIYHDRLKPSTLRRALAAMKRFCSAEDITDAVCVVQHPFWEPMASALKEAYGWKIVYDCMDDHKGFDNNSDEVLGLESQLLRSSDLVVTTAKILQESISPHHHNCVMIPNAGDYGHFSSIPPRAKSPLARLKAPVIGYYGAIAEWFDIAAVTLAAKRHPEWSFALIGRTSGEDFSELAALPNVKFFGEKTYAELPGFVAGFDVCTIPFRRIPLTEATNPVKLFEYLGAGKPVVARDLPELEAYSDIVSLYATAEEFVTCLERAVGDTEPPAVEKRREVARRNTWADRYATLYQQIERLYEKVSIIVVTYKSVEKTRLTIQSVLEKTRYPNYEIIVVDNGGDEAIRAFLSDVAKRFPETVRLAFQDRNLGFAAGNNVGIEMATQSDYIALLNDDVIVTPGWLGRLLAHLRDHQVGAVGPVTNFCGNEARIQVDYTDTEAVDNFARTYTEIHEGMTFTIDVLAMYCIAMRRQVVDEIGLLDEQFGVGMFEDDDYAMRLRRAGYHNVCAEDVFVHHFGRSSFSQMHDEVYRETFETNRRLFEEKWQQAWTPHKSRGSHNGASTLAGRRVVGGRRLVGSE